MRNRNPMYVLKSMVMVYGMYIICYVCVFVCACMYLSKCAQSQSIVSIFCLYIFPAAKCSNDERLSVSAPLTLTPSIDYTISSSYSGPRIRKDLDTPGKMTRHGSDCTLTAGSFCQEGQVSKCPKCPSCGGLTDHTYIIITIWQCWLTTTKH